MVDACKKHIHPHQHTLSADGKFSWMEVECLGACVNAPMLQIGKDFYEDLDGPLTEKLIADLRAGKAIKPGPANSRHTSEPEGGVTSLTDKALYDGSIIGKYKVQAPAAPANTDAEAKKPTKAASDRETLHPSPWCSSPAPASSLVNSSGCVLIEKNRYRAYAASRTTAVPTLSSVSSRTVLSGAKNRLKALGTARLITAISIIVL